MKPFKLVFETDDMFFEMTSPIVPVVGDNITKGDNYYTVIGREFEVFDSEVTDEQFTKITLSLEEF